MTIKRYDFGPIEPQDYESADGKYMLFAEHEQELAEVEAVVQRYRTAMDDIYNHNDAAREAVVQYFGTLHPIVGKDGDTNERN